jgi:hypothetical protein
MTKTWLGGRWSPQSSRGGHVIGWATLQTYRALPDHISAVNCKALNKIYTLSNTTILYFINLNIGD